MTMSGDTNDRRTGFNETDTEDDLGDLDIWKPPTRLRNLTSSLQVPGSSGLFQKKFQEQRNAEEAEKEIEVESKHRRNSKRHLRTKRQRAAKRAASHQASPDLNNEEEEEKWERVRPFMKAHDHIQGPVGHGKYGPKTELEKEIDEAIAKDDMDKAQELSDKIAVREFGVKVSRAFGAQRAWEKKIIDEMEKIAKKRKRLPWGFEAKERWEMKGNL